MNADPSPRLWLAVDPCCGTCGRFPTANILSLCSLEGCSSKAATRHASILAKLVQYSRAHSHEKALARFIIALLSAPPLPVLSSPRGPMNNTVSSEMSNRPPTPSSTIHVGSDLRFHDNGTPCEWGELYRPGGFYPVQIGHTLNGRYDILCKLGYGSFATVWLAADSWSVFLHSPRTNPCLFTDSHHSPARSKTFVAIKILKASVSQSANSELSLYRLLGSAGSEPAISPYVVGLLASFELVGPNGKHTCFVLEFMGPNLSDMLRWQEFEVGDPFDDDFCRRLPKHLAKRILKDLLRGLQFLHSNKVVHGDVHKGNILVNARLPKCTADSLEILRQPADQARPLERLDGKKDLWAPPYLLPPANLRSFVSTELDPVIKLTDMGEGQ